MLDQNQTQQLVALLQFLASQRKGGGAQPQQQFAGLPGLRGNGGMDDFGAGPSSGGLGGLGSVGGYGTNGPSVSSAPAGPGLGPNGWSTTTGPYGDPLNSVVGLGLALLSSLPATAMPAQIAQMVYGLGNKVGVFGQPQQGPGWIEKYIAPAMGLPIVGKPASLLTFAGRTFAASTLSDIIDRKLELDVSRMPTPAPGYTESDIAAIGDPPEIDKSLELDVSLPPGFSFTDLDNFAAGYTGADFGPDAYADIAGTGYGSLDDSSGVGDGVGDGGMGDFGGDNDDLSDGGMGGEGDAGDAGDGDAGGEGEGEGEGDGDGDW